MKITKKKKTLLIILGIGVVGIACACGGFFLLGAIASKDPGVQATGTARTSARLSETAIFNLDATGSAMPTYTITPSRTPEPTNTRTATRTPTPTETLDPSITPPTPTPTPSSTITPTFTHTPTMTPTPTFTHTPTRTLTPTRTYTPTLAPTLIPENAGISEWIIYDGLYVGVRDIDWNYYLGYYRPDAGKIYVSLYIVVINMDDYQRSVSEYDISLIDGGGEITSGVIFGEKEPEFSGCTLIPGGSCEGWWTTMIWDRPEVRANLTLRWNPCLISCGPFDVYINQE